MYIDAGLKKSLSDRVYDKRKPAALQLEQIARRAYESGNTKVVDGIINELSREFAYAVRNPNYRNGGLIGLAGVAIALGPSGLPTYLDDIIQPILACFGDADARVRYYACEALYNVAKVAKGEILAYFNEIFDALCRLTADVEEAPRNGANLVDQLIRDIVVESASTYVFVIDRTKPNLVSAIVQPDGPEGASYQKSSLYEQEDFAVRRDSTSAIIDDESPFSSSNVANAAIGGVDSAFAAAQGSNALTPSVSASVPATVSASTPVQTQPQSQPQSQTLVAASASASGSASASASTPVSATDPAPASAPASTAASTTTGTLSNQTETENGSNGSNKTESHPNSSNNTPLINPNTGGNAINGNSDTLNNNTASNSQSNTAGRSESDTGFDAETETGMHPVTSTNSLSSVSTSANPNQNNMNNELNYAKVPIVSRGREHSFTLERFIPLLVERIYVINPATRMFLVHWVMLLDSIPELELAKYIPNFLEGLLLFLTDNNKEIRTYTRTCLNGLLDEIKKIAEVQRERSTSTEVQGIDAGLYIRGQSTQIYYSRIVEILLSRMDPSHEETRLVILDWLTGLLGVCPNDVISKLSALVTVLLPSISDELPQVRHSAKALSEQILKMIPAYTASIDSAATVQSLGRQLENEDNATRIQALEWLVALYKVNKLGGHSEELLPKLIAPLSDPYTDVVTHDLELLGLILGGSDQEVFTIFFRKLLHVFRQDRVLFQNCGKFICLRLSVLLNPMRVFETFALICEEGDAGDEFNSLVVQNMCNILIGASELHDFRTQLTQLHTEAGASLFTTLFKSWRRNSVAVLALCLLAEAYKYAYACLEILAKVDVTVNTLVQIDKLIQSIEGPVFAPLRLHLLDPWGYPYLYKTLYGMLMVLPQSNAFKVLQSRLNSVSAIISLPMLASENVKEDPSDLINWEELLQEYKSAQDRKKDVVTL
ncbi:Vac14 protein [Starmerella bacillaris]|uniref:Vac14 protein n=1 Tax=Starmerella bacillaris TaxID=1247836 RepID=A0AAV5REN5_STABA|nr:Vac14 protein [Starmerella bacillaris]